MDIITEKSAAILMLESAKNSGASRRDVQDLASRAASLETTVAEQFLDAERGQDAAISFLSAASCMKDARRFEEAARLLNRAVVYATTEPLREAILVERHHFARRLAEIFTRADAKHEAAGCVA
jgi:hypothetical protein